MKMYYNGRTCFNLQFDDGLIVEYGWTKFGYFMHNNHDEKKMLPYAAPYTEITDENTKSVIYSMLRNIALRFNNKRIRFVKDECIEFYSNNDVLDFFQVFYNRLDDLSENTQRYKKSCRLIQNILISYDSNNTRDISEQ